MADQRHTIGRIMLDLALQKEEGHFATQERWSAIIRDKLATRLSEIFDHYIPANELWRLDKLDLDLGFVEEKISDREIVDRITKQVRESLEQYKSTANGHFEKIPVEMAELNAMIFFLQNGYLPERVLDLDVTKVFREHIVTNFSGLAKSLEEQISKESSKAEIAAQRMARQFPEKDFLKFLEKYIHENSGKELGWLPLFYEKIAVISGRQSTKLRELFWFVFFKILFEKKPIQVSFGNAFFQGFFTEVIMIKGGQDFLKKTYETIPKKIQPLLKNALQEKENSAQKEEITSEAEAEIVEGMFCKNAGVVLLHPFLTRFFSSLSLLAEDRKTFQDKGKAEEAVHWLHYLATGMDEAPEQDLAFAKFLCGLKIAAPIRRGTAFSQEEKEGAEALLEAAIGHWNVLKNTSPNGLREGFLQRQGRLTKKQNGSLLEMENKAQDILLGQLPWGMSVVHFPWMEAPLWVQWG